MIAILNYEAGNLTSVQRALNHEKIPCQITADPDALYASQGIIFPGVGAAGSAMSHLLSTGLDQVLVSLISAGKPMLGICLGCQILLEASAENNTRTLNIVPGKCERFHPDLHDEMNDPINIPHMGWNSVYQKQQCLLFQDVPEDAEFYFVHSYYPVPDPDYVLGTTHYGTTFTSVFGRTGLWAMQFHPEKSGRPGLKILNNFYRYCLEQDHA